MSASNITEELVDRFIDLLPGKPDTEQNTDLGSADANADLERQWEDYDNLARATQESLMTAATATDGLSEQKRGEPEPAGKI